MTTQEQTMIDIGCPECGCDIELYDTNSTGDGGHYRCTKCPRDTVWAVGKAMSALDLFSSVPKEFFKSLPTKS